MNNLNRIARVTLAGMALGLAVMLWRWLRH
jgi:hypothetical protein